MSKAVEVVPAGPGTPQGDPFPIRETHSPFGTTWAWPFATFAGVPAFRGAGEGTMARVHRGCLLLAVQRHEASAEPGDDPATFSGYSARAVRDYVEVLERAGIVRLRRERRPTWRRADLLRARARDLGGARRVRGVLPEGPRGPACPTHRKPLPLPPPPRRK